MNFTESNIRYLHIIGRHTHKHGLRGPKHKYVFVFQI
uniref:Uncharacterized protein n=1 Tax=Rhizophora mucronata TaxID=61149 RepID=A0A2P2QIK2_RHIMU